MDFSFPTQWTIYIAFNTQNLDHGTAMEIRRITGSSGWWRMQLFTGPAVEVSRDVRYPLKLHFNE